MLKTAGDLAPTVTLSSKAVLLDNHSEAVAVLPVAWWSIFLTRPVSRLMVADPAMDADLWRSSVIAG